MGDRERFLGGYTAQAQERRSAVSRLQSEAFLKRFRILRADLDEEAAVGFGEECHSRVFIQGGNIQQIM